MYTNTRKRPLEIVASASGQPGSHFVWSSWGSLRASRLYVWDPWKLPPWVFFWGRQCAFVFPIYVRKYRKYTIDPWIMVYTVCASAVISPLRQWLDSYAKTRLKMWHTSKHFIHMQYFLLPNNLVIIFVHWVSTGVLYEPRQCSLFLPQSVLQAFIPLGSNQKQRCGSEFAK